MESSISQYSPYVQAKTGRMELGTSFDAIGHVVKGAGSWYQVISDKSLAGGFAQEFTGDDVIGRTTRALYNNRPARWLEDRPDMAMRIGSGIRAGGIGVAGYAHTRRLLVDINAISRITPENTTSAERAAIYSDTASASANILSCLAYIPGLLFFVGNPASKAASVLLLAATASIAWLESSTWAANSLSTLWVEGERSRKTGDYNASAYFESIGNAVLSVSLFLRYNFIFEQGLQTFRGGDYAAANKMTGLLKVSYEDKKFDFSQSGVGRVGRAVCGGNLKALVGRLTYFSEGARFLFNGYMLASNAIMFCSDSDDVSPQVREKNIKSFTIGLISNAISLATILCFLNYPTTPAGYWFMALSGGIRVFHSMFDHGDEKADKSKQRA